AVAWLHVDDWTPAGRRGPGDQVTGRGMRPRWAGAGCSEHLVERLSERADRCVGAHQRDDVRLEDRAAVQLVGQGEVLDADAHRMVGIDDPGYVLGVSEPGVGPALAPQLGGSVVVAAAEHLSPGRPPRPAGEGVVQEHDSL